MAVVATRAVRTLGELRAPAAYTPPMDSSRPEEPKTETDELGEDELESVSGGVVVPRPSGGTTIAFPDVCKTPAPPAGPVPIPYPNTSSPSRPKPKK